jgi:hypothetical protein
VRNMSNEPQESDDGPLTAEEKARFDAFRRKAEAAWEVEATERYGPPNVRTRKNRRYAARLVRKHTEPTIRGLLKALAILDDPMCCENLRNHDLDAEPLEQIIQPFELLGLDFRILSVSTNRFTVDIGEAYGNVGSGGAFVVERLNSGSFHILDTISQWIA